MQGSSVFKAQQFDAAIKLTRIRSKKTISALKAHLVDGVKQADCVRQYQVDKALLSRSAARLKQVNLMASQVCA